MSAEDSTLHNTQVHKERCRHMIAMHGCVATLRMSRVYGCMHGYMYACITARTCELTLALSSSHFWLANPGKSQEQCPDEVTSNASEIDPPPAPSAPLSVHGLRQQQQLLQPASQR